MNKWQTIDMLTTDILTANDIMLMRLKYPDGNEMPGYEIEYLFIEFYEEHLKLNELPHSDEELWYYFNEMFHEDFIDAMNVDGYF